MACLNLATCWHASQAQDASKTFQDVHKTPTRRAKRPPRHPKTHPGRTQNAPRTLPGRSKMPQDALKTPDEAIRTLQETSKMLQDLPKTPQAPRDLDFGAVAPGFLKLVGPPDPTLDSLKLHVGWFYDLWPTACQITYVSLLFGSPLPSLPPAAPTCMTTMQKLMPQISIALRFLHSLSDTAINSFIT